MRHPGFFDNTSKDAFGTAHHLKELCTQNGLGLWLSLVMGLLSVNCVCVSVCESMTI